MTGAGFTVKLRTRSGSALGSSAQREGVGSSAHLLAIAHAIDRLVEAGSLPSYGEAARRLGISHVRMSNICTLVQLAPNIQEAILDGGLIATERALRPVCRLMAWDQQRSLLALGDPRSKHSGSEHLLNRPGDHGPNARLPAWDSGQLSRSAGPTRATAMRGGASA